MRGFGRHSVCSLQFLPFAQIPDGRRRVKLVQFVLKLDPQWQVERSRLDNLEDSLVRIRQSEILRCLCTICAEVHKEMHVACSIGGLFEAAPSPPEGEGKPEDAVYPLPAASKIWRTAEELRNALKHFCVWEDSGDFNFRCLNDAARIQPSRLQGFSLLHVILLRLKQQLSHGAERHGGSADVQGGELQQQWHFYQRNIPQLLELHLNSTSVETVVIPPGNQANAFAAMHSCRCLVCLELSSVRNGRLQKWRNRRKTMKEEQIFMKKPCDPSAGRTPPQHLNGEAEVRC